MKNNIKEEKKFLAVHVGYASRAAASGMEAFPQMRAEAAEELMPEVCGDTAVSCRLPDGSRAVILSDGMGHGDRAAAESRAAAGVLRRLLKQGIPTAKAIREMNRYLLERNLKKEDGESYATVDLAIIDQVSGRARFYKMGAAPSYIVRGRRIRKIQRPALPAGILPGVQLTYISARLSPGDIIIMVSDGICDSGWRCGCGTSAEAEMMNLPESDWIKSFLDDMICGYKEKGQRGRPGPRQMAGALLAEAGRRYGSSETDDATVAVAVIQ